MISSVPKAHWSIARGSLPLECRNTKIMNDFKRPNGTQVLDQATIRSQITRPKRKQRNIKTYASGWCSRWDQMLM